MNKLKELVSVFDLNSFVAKTGKYLSCEDLTEEEYYPQATFSDEVGVFGIHQTNAFRFKGGRPFDRIILQKLIASHSVQEPLRLSRLLLGDPLSLCLPHCI